MHQRTKILIYVLFLMLSGVGALLLYFLDPMKVRIFPSCAFYGMTGLYCPSCGLTRAIHSFLNFQILQAVRQNIFIVLLVTMFIFGNVYAIGCVILEKQWCSRVYLNQYVAVSFLVVALLYTVLRNIPVAPFTYLAP